MMIRKFRQFNNIEFYMGKYITAISGHNATGEIKYRTTWQDEKTRFRIIPDRINELGKKSAAKIGWTTLYLGLSRLYPVGEINKISNQKRAF